MHSQIKINNSISGLLNDKGKKYIILLIHGFQASKKTKQFNEIEDMLNSKGLSTLRIDLFGHGDMKDKFPSLTVSKAIETIKESIKYLKNQGFEKIGLIGSSFGGSTGFFAAINNSDLSFLILKSPLSKNQGDIIVKFKNIDLDEWKNKNLAKWTDKFGEHELKYDFYIDANKYDFSNHISKINLPTLIIHGELDSVVPVEHSLRFQNSKNIIVKTIKTADHKYKPEETKIMVDYIEEFVMSCWDV